MDLSTLIGLAGAFGVILWGIMMGSSITIFIDIPSVLITCGGTVFALMIAYRFSDIINTIRVTKMAFFYKSMSMRDISSQLVEISIQARKEGLLALEQLTAGISDPFFQKGIQLVVDGHEAEEVENIMGAEIDAMNDRHKMGSDFFMSFATFAPAMGLIGTLIGLVQMLQNMSDPSSIGPAMAVALITTFYGAIMANVMGSPMAAKLTLRAKEETLAREMILAGVLAISSGDNPRVVEQKLNSYLPPKMRSDRFGGGEEK